MSIKVTTKEVIADLTAELRLKTPQEQQQIRRLLLLTRDRMLADQQRNEQQEQRRYEDELAENASNMYKVAFWKSNKDHQT